MVTFSVDGIYSKRFMMSRVINMKYLDQMQWSYQDVDPELDNYLDRLFLPLRVQTQEIRRMPLNEE